MAEHQLSRIWDDALSLYTETTGINLHDTRFPKPQSAEDLLNQLDRQQSTFADFRKKKAKIFNALSCFLTPVERLGKVASDGASTVFAPSLLIFGAVIYLINVCTTLLRQPRARRDSYGTADAVDRCKAAHGVSAAYDAIISLFETMDESISRLSVHLQHEISPQLRRIVTEILVTLMSICARSTKYIKEGRALKYLKGLLGRGSAVQGALDRLKTLTENEAKMVVALTLSQASKTGKTVDDLAAWMDALRSVSGDKERKQILRWLKAPDPNTRHNAECNQHQPNTGGWLIDNEAYRSWKSEPASLLWLHGLAGCGKSNLCSTVIEDIKCHCQSHKAEACAYFYFDFNNSEMQRHENLLRSLALQLLERCSVTPNEIERLYSSHQQGEQPPTVHDLTTILRCLVDRFPQTYIIVDALDECSDWAGVLSLIEHIVGWKINNLRLLVTSRREKRLEECLQALQPVLIPVQSSQVEGDIRLHVRQCLFTKAELKKWPAPVQTEMEEALVIGAQGMFQWVICQLDALQKCIKLGQLRTVLKTLPKTLDDTYVRILSRIDDDYREDVLRILQWLCFSSRPIRLDEAVEVLAVSLEETVFDPEQRLPDPRDILMICSGLVTVDTEFEITADHVFMMAVNGKSAERLRLAHYSVKEFLVSTQIRTGPVERFSVSPAPAALSITKICLVYLLHLDSLDCLGPDRYQKYPLLKYAAENWVAHYLDSADQAAGAPLDVLVMKLVRSQDRFLNWVQSVPGLEEQVFSPLYYMLLLGLPHIAKQLIAEGTDVNIRNGHGSALGAASERGYKDVVELLLDKGADVNTFDESWGTVLAVASGSGHLKVVNLLLEKGADANAHVKDLGMKIPDSSHRRAMDRLLRKKRGLNPYDELWPSALVAASRSNHNEIAELLLEKGADVNACDEKWPSALAAASESDSKWIAGLLLEKGADVNAQGSDWGTALVVASDFGRKEIVELLLEKGANVNAQGGFYGTALIATSCHGHKEIVELLMEKGADVNAQGGHYSTALIAASVGGHEEIVELLMEKGADVNAQGGYYSTALTVASRGGHKEIVELLLEKGADVSISGEDGGSAYQAAVQEGHTEVIELLRASGAQNTKLEELFC